MKLKSYHLLLFPILLILLLAGCQSNTPPAATQEESAELLHFRLGMNPYFSNAPLFVAQQEGFFEDAGLEMEYVFLESSRESIPAIIQGDLDAFGPALSVSLFNAFAQDAPLALVADKGYFRAEGDCYASLFISPGQAEQGGLEALDTLEGQSYLSGPGNISEFGIERWLRDNYDLDLAQISFDRIPNELTGEALVSGTGLLAFRTEPERTPLLESGQGILLADASDMMPDTQWAAITFGPTIINDNPELGRRFMVAYLRAVRQYAEGKTDRNIQIMADATGLDPEQIEALCWPSVGETLTLNTDYLQDFVDWGVATEQIDRAFSIDDFVDMSYVDYAFSQADGGN